MTTHWELLKIGQLTLEIRKRLRGCPKQYRGLPEVKAARATLADLSQSRRSGELHDEPAVRTACKAFDSAMRNAGAKLAATNPLKP